MVSKVQENCALSPPQGVPTEYKINELQLRIDSQLFPTTHAEVIWYFHCNVIRFGV